MIKSAPAPAHARPRAGRGSGAAGAGRIDFAVATERLGVGERTGPRCSAHERVLLVVDGVADAHVGEGRVRLRGGMTALVPSAVGHEIINVGSGPLQLLVASPDR